MASKFGKKRTKPEEKSEVKPEVVEKETTEEGTEEETTELVVMDGRSFEVLAATGDSVFTNALTVGMDPEERKEKVREVLQKAEQFADRLNLVQGELLYEVTNNQYWKDWKFEDKKEETRAFTDFKEYW